MLNFVWPWVLVLIPVPFIYRSLRKPAEVQIQALRSPQLLKMADESSSNHTRLHSGQFKLLILMLIWLGVLLALARPVWVGDPVALPTSGRDILMAVDISGSMEREDMIVDGSQVNRLSAVKSVVGDFVTDRQGDRLGLILFGERAYLQTPLTFDSTTMQILLNEAQIGFAGNGTAIGDAIGLAIKRLQDRPENHRILILLTDGANTAGELDPVRAATLANQAKVKIYTIGIGSDRQESWGLFGKRVTNPSADLDEKTLMDIADITKGQYFRAHNPEELAEIYHELNRLEPIDQESEVIRPVKSLYYWPLAVAFVFSLALILALRQRGIA